jgi:cellulose synthase/poly-beta-1,6-N-acetylglucosamine synthase-like glycosyltransferase
MFSVVQVLIGYNLVLPFILYILYLARHKREAAPVKESIEYDYAIIVTAYEQTETLAAAVQSILELDYKRYMVYVVADKCDVSQLKFDSDRVVVLRPPKTLASNIRSHFYAINHFVRAHEILTIIDSDNLVDPRYLNQLNKSFDAGFDAVQGLRKAKNLDTTYACLDAARDIYYHFYDGEVLFQVGSSATLAGSGMAFKTSLYRECLAHLDVLGAGFDKVLQNEILRRGHRIAFNKLAIVYDEKTSGADQLVKQRARWMNTWFRYFKFGFFLIADGLKSKSYNKFLFGLILLRPPLFIFLLVSAIFSIADIWLSSTYFFLWAVGFCCFLVGFIIAFFHSNPDKRVVRALIKVPKFMFYQIVSLFLVKKANKMSVATQHYNNKTINEIENEL